MTIDPSKCLLDRDLLIRIDERQNSIFEKIQSVYDHMTSNSEKLEHLESEIDDLKTKIQLLENHTKTQEEYISKKAMSWNIAIFAGILGTISAIVSAVFTFYKLRS